MRSERTAVRKGIIDLKVELDLEGSIAGQVSTVDVRGPFEVPEDGGAPKVDLDVDWSFGSENYLGGSKVASDGRRAEVTLAGRRYPFARLDDLMRDGVGKQRVGLWGVGLDTASWVRSMDARTGQIRSRGRQAEGTEGRPDVAAMLQDIGEFMATYAAPGLLPSISRELAEQIARGATETSLGVEALLPDKDLREITAHVDFRLRDPSPELAGLRSGSIFVLLRVSEVGLVDVPPLGAAPQRRLRDAIGASTTRIRDAVQKAIRGDRRLERCTRERKAVRVLRCAGR